MKNMKNFIKNNVKVVIAFVIGLIIAGGGAVVVATTIASDSITYTGNGQSTVKGALDTLYTYANNDVLENVNSFTKINRAKSIYATDKGICFIKDGKLNCFKFNNYTYEKEHMKKVFASGRCHEGTSDGISSIYCYDSSSGTYKFECHADTSGVIVCMDYPGSGSGDDFSSTCYGGGSYYESVQCY